MEWLVNATLRTEQGHRSSLQRPVYWQQVHIVLKATWNQTLAICSHSGRSPHEAPPGEEALNTELKCHLLSKYE